MAAHHVTNSHMLNERNFSQLANEIVTAMACRPSTCNRWAVSTQASESSSMSCLWKSHWSQMSCTSGVTRACKIVDMMGHDKTVEN